MPASRRMLVPELPTSSTRRARGAVRAAGDASSPLDDARPSPRPRRGCGPRRRRRRARAPSTCPRRGRRASRARWEIDLSPGTRTVPRSGEPPTTVNVLTPAVGRRGPVAARDAARSRTSSVDPASTTRTSTPRGPSAECAISRSSMFTPSSAGERGDLGQHAGPVGNRDAHLDQVLGPGGRRRQVHRGPRGPAPAGAAARRGRPRDHGSRMSASALHERVERRDDRVAVLGADVGPDAGVARRRCGSCPGSRRRPAAAAAACSSARSDASPISVAAVRWGTWETTATSASWWSGRQRDHVGAERRHDRADTRVGLRVGVDRGRQHPGRAVEQLGVGAVHALLLGAGHRVAADEARMVDGGHDRGLHPADVGDDAAARGGAPGLGGDRRHGHGDERELGIGVVADRVERAELEGALGAGVVEVAAGDVPAPRPQREADGTADEPGPDDAPQPGRSSRRPLAPSRYTWRSSPRGASVVRCIITRMHRGVPPSTSSSRAQSRGRRPGPAPGPPWPGTSSGCRRWR